MLSVKLILSKRTLVLACLAAGCHVAVRAQENSPFTRYGIGDLFANSQVQYNGMGGMTAAQGLSQVYGQPNFSSTPINTGNPASYGQLRTLADNGGGLVTYELGLLADVRSLKAKGTTKSYSSTNFMPSYFAMAFPLHEKGLGMALGFKPVSRINYDLSESHLLSTRASDSVINQYTGEGGISQVFLGVGKAFGNFRVGVNGAYNFGKKDIKTITLLRNTDFPYLASTKRTLTHYRGITWNAGMQYTAKLIEETNPVSKIKNMYTLDLGVNGSISQRLMVSRDMYVYRIAGSIDNPVSAVGDTVSVQEGQKDKIVLPASISGGFMVNNYIGGLQRFGAGAEYNYTNWASYRDIGNVADTALVNSWMVRVGGYLIPDPLRGNSTFALARYSLGGYLGKDYIAAGTVSKAGYDVMALTFGIAFKLRKQMYSNQSSLINTAFEVGRRSASDSNLSENFYKLSVGFSLSDLWLRKRRYD